MFIPTRSQPLNLLGSVTKRNSVNHAYHATAKVTSEAEYHTKFSLSKIVMPISIVIGSLLLIALIFYWKIAKPKAIKESAKMKEIIESVTRDGACFIDPDVLIFKEKPLPAPAPVHPGPAPRTTFPNQPHAAPSMPVPNIPRLHLPPQSPHRASVYPFATGMGYNAQNPSSWNTRSHQNWKYETTPPSEPLLLMPGTHVPSPCSLAHPSAFNRPINPYHSHDGPTNYHAEFYIQPAVQYQPLHVPPQAHCLPRPAHLF